MATPINDEEIRRLREEISGCQRALSKAITAIERACAEFTMWRETRCDNHHERIKELEDDAHDQNKMIWKAAGIAAAVPTIVILFALALQISGAIH